MVMKKFAGAVVALEGLAVLGSYIFWRRLNRDQVYSMWEIEIILNIFKEFRFTAFHSFPSALEFYYQMGEAIEPENKIREYDLMVWRRDGRLREQ